MAATQGLLFIADRLRGKQRREAVALGGKPTGIKSKISKELYVSMFRNSAVLIPNFYHKGEHKLVNQIAWNM